MTRRAVPTATTEQVEFGSPPAIEVALAVAFQPLPLLGAVEVVRLWESNFRRDFPKVEEQARVMMPIEQFGSPSSLPSFRFELAEAPRLPRLWFLCEDESELLQVQNDWFARNWRQRDAGPEYPHYPRIRDPFAADLGHLISHIKRRKLGSFVPIHCELTYINHIPLTPGESDIKRVLTFFAGDAPPGPLGEPEAVRFAVQWLISHEGEPVGRLHLTAEPAVRQSDMQAVTVLTMTARGRPIGEGADGVLSFMDLAHDFVVRTFVAVTTDKMHNVWGLKS
jgi:uncharacterized protein (TIGR04255 family)